MHWIFLRGLAREQRHWGTFPALFERVVPGARVHCLDLPGAGTERGRPSPTTVEAIADDVRARWLALRDAHPGPWGLFGMSLGGMTAAAWCARHPDDFARLVLAGASAGDLSPPWRRFGLGVLPAALAALAERDPVRREARILSMVARVTPDRATVAQAWALYPPMARANVLRQVRAARAWRAPRRLDVPVLLVAGGGDALADPSCSRRLAAHLGAPLAIHPDAGHELALDAPEWLAGEVAAWLETTDRAGRQQRGPLHDAGAAR